MHCVLHLMSHVLLTYSYSFKKEFTRALHQPEAISLGKRKEARSRLVSIVSALERSALGVSGSEA